MYLSIAEKSRWRVVLAASVLACGNSAWAAPPQTAEQSLLTKIENENRLISDAVRTEVELELKAARLQMADHPAAVGQQLKLTIGRVMHVSELSAELRARLRADLESAVREANLLESVVVDAFYGRDGRQTQAQIESMIGIPQGRLNSLTFGDVAGDFRGADDASCSISDRGNGQGDINE